MKRYVFAVVLVLLAGFALFAGGKGSCHDFDPVPEQILR
jgi:hypothetical protein